MCLFLFQYHCYFGYMALYYILNSYATMSIALSFLLLIALGIWGLLWLHMNFRIFSVSVTNVIVILIGIALSLILLWVAWPF